MTHYIPAFTRENGRVQQAVCGVYVHKRDHSVQPTCLDCLKYLVAEDAKSAQYGSVEEEADALFGPLDPLAKPIFARDPNFDACAGYAPKKGRR